MSPRPSRIFLTGFSFSGKSRVAGLVAEKLGWQAVDTDALIEKIAGKPIPRIFAEEGEARFRQFEREAVREAAGRENAVVAVGGGAIVSAKNRRAMADSGFVVCLEARPETIFARLTAGSGESPSERPLLAGADPLGRIRHLKALRQPLYALADFTVHTDALSMEQVASEVVRAWQENAEKVAGKPDRLDSGVTPAAAAADASGPTCRVSTESGTYPVHVEWGGLDGLGALMREAGLSGVAYVVSDSDVHPHYGRRAEDSLRDAGFEADSCVVPAGEASKSLETASRIYEWLVGRRAERGHAIVALGGGMIGDLAGFVAATFLRGLPLVHVPTSLLAMVDASIGGKVAVDLREAKNLVGAFYQPRLVVSDVAALKTLPPRELTAGWAEVTKHALIQDADLLALLEEAAPALTGLEPEITTEVVRRSVAIKAQVVSEDERETTGRRTILNYGHTVGHALEAAADYAGLLHGEAVAIGMTAAAEIGHRMEVTPPALVERQKALLARFGLPVKAPALTLDRVLDAIALDKKVSGKAVRWVLLADVGLPVLRQDVPEPLVRQVVAELLR
jgi:shikimate kinase/3-dehydroquinate synthase